MKVPDVIALIISVGVFILFFISAYYNNNSGEAMVHVQSEKEEWYYPLDTTAELVLTGPAGLTRVFIEEGRVFVAESGCAEKICIKQGHAKKSGEWIACLPNKVLITIEAGEAEFDAQSY